jgi:hypothetical protein
MYVVLNKLFKWICTDKIDGVINHGLSIHLGRNRGKTEAMVFDPENDIPKKTV